MTSATFMSYYDDKLDTLQSLFGGEVRLDDNGLIVAGKRYPIVDDVILLLDPEQNPGSARDVGRSTGQLESFSADVQHTFGEEWTKYPEILSEHKADFFDRYFDIVDLDSLRDKRICDLGCGIGRWSHFLADEAREIVAVDFSEAIFIARKNLRQWNNILYFKADLTQLPFRDDCFDFLFCLGVLHHLPTDCLEELIRTSRLSPQLLVYLYYALDNRPFHFHLAFKLGDAARRITSRIKSRTFRSVFTISVLLGVYYPLIALGNVLRPFGLSAKVPLWEGYHGRGWKRIEQDVYDRFFTSIEQRVTRKQIRTLEQTFSKVLVSERIPYWHFLCIR